MRRAVQGVLAGLPTARHKAPKSAETISRARSACSSLTCKSAPWGTEYPRAPKMTEGMPSFSKASLAISANLRGKLLTSAMSPSRSDAGSRPPPNVDEARADEGHHQPEDDHLQRQPDVHVGAVLEHRETRYDV